MRHLILLTAAAGAASAVLLGGTAAAAPTTAGTWTLYPPQTQTTVYQAAVQQPINADGLSSWPAKKGVIPVQFALSSAEETGPVVFQSIYSDNTSPNDGGGSCYTGSGADHANDCSYLSFTPSSTLTFADITNLSADYSFTTGNCHGGALRWSVETSLGNLFIYYGDLPNYTDCTTNSQSGTNMIGLSDLRYDTSQIGGTFYDSYSDALSLLGSTPIEGISLVLDAGWYNAPDGDQIASVSNVTVNDNTFQPLPVGTTSFTPTCDLPTAAIKVTKTAGDTPGDISEVSSVSAADSTGYFRQVDCKYIYNLAVSSLSGAGTYGVYVNIDGTNINDPGEFGLR